MIEELLTKGSEYLAEAAEKCSKEAPREWLKSRQEEVKTGQISKVIAILKKEIEGKGKSEEDDPIKKCLRYIESRPGQFKYKEPLAAELPIGSREIESGNRSVIQKRSKIF